jgi:flagellar biosynthesis protein FlhA
MISISGGLIVTRASSDARLGVDFKKQMFSNPQPLLLASGVLMALSAFPGLPTIPFLLLGAGMGTSAWRMRQRGLDNKKVSDAKAAAPARENLETTLKVEPLAVEVGLGLVKLVDGGANSQLLRRISGIRRQLAGDLGYIFPPVRVTDNLALRPREYAISLKGVEIARYEIPQGCDLAIPVGKTPAPVSGQATREPAFGMPAWWIPSDQAERARRSNYTVVDAVSVLGTHLAELIRRHSHELFSRQETKKLLDRVGADNPKVVEELTPKLLPLATVQRVLQNLLRERVSIRDAVSILEELSDAGASTRNPILLTEYVRQSIRRTVVKPYLNASGDLPAYFVDPSIEQSVESVVQHGEQNSHLAMAPQAIREILNRIEQKVGSPETPVVAVTSSGARYFLRQMAETSQANVVFLSHNEVPPEVKVVSQGLIQ